jgi:hypothetical protein
MSDQMGGDIFEEAMSSEDRAEVIAQINKIDGVSNASFEILDETRMVFKFDFEDVESLNGAFADIQIAMMEKSALAGEGMKGMDPMGMGLGLPRFAKKGKVISHDSQFPVDKFPEGALEEIDALGGSGTMDMVLGMMDYTIVLSSDRKIKSVKYDGVELISQDKNAVKVRIDLGKMLNGATYNIEITTK